MRFLFSVLVVAFLALAWAPPDVFWEPPEDLSDATSEVPPEPELDEDGNDAELAIGSASACPCEETSGRDVVGWHEPAGEKDPKDVIPALDPRPPRA